MRKLPPVRAVLHAFGSVSSYRYVGIRIGLVWLAILGVIGLIGLAVSGPDPEQPRTAAANAVELASLVAGLFAFASIAVSWHCFVLRDHMPPGVFSLRLDEAVWRYIGNSLLVLAAAAAPLLVLAALVSLLPPVAALVAAAAAVVAGAFAMRLSVKLPAVALGRRDFTFADALSATEGNFWPIVAVFLINGVIVMVTVLVLVFIVSAIAAKSLTLAALVGLALSLPVNLFYTLFSVSILTSLYGFFVEGRDF